MWAEAAELISGYSNLEFDLEEGERGARDGHLTAICRTLFGCEAAILTNNNAAGTMLALAAGPVGSRTSREELARAAPPSLVGQPAQAGVGGSSCAQDPRPDFLRLVPRHCGYCEHEVLHG